MQQCFTGLEGGKVVALKSQLAIQKHCTTTSEDEHSVSEATAVQMDRTDCGVSKIRVRSAMRTTGG